MKKFVASINIFFQVIQIVFFTSAVYAADWQLRSELRKADAHCLALNIYYETRAVSLADAMAVTDVVMNRVNSRHFPNTACEVVKQSKLDSNGNPKRHKCQFSWYCDGKSDKPRNQEAWDRSQKFASDMYNFGTYIGITEGATHYHASYVQPNWAPGFDRITRIGSHYFYRMK